MATDKIPVYGLNSFRSGNPGSGLFQIERFDAHRHFQVAYPHRHDFYEVLFIEKGSGFHIIDTNKYHITPPCVFFLSPGQAHKLELSQDIEGYIFLFTSEFYSLFDFNANKLLEFPFFFSIEQENPPLYISSSHDADFIAQLFRRGSTLMSQNAVQHHEVIHALLQLLLLSCNQLYQHQIESVKQGKSHILVKKFLVALEENYLQQYHIDFYAQALSVTPNHLTQIIKHITGKTTIALIQEKRLIEIKRLLLHSHLNSSQIAEHLHFADISYFTKFFKKYTGITPLQYRKQERKKYS